jgi:hypothetical protein
MVFSTADRNEFFSIPVSIIRDRAQLAPPSPSKSGTRCGPTSSVS